MREKERATMAEKELNQKNKKSGDNAHDRRGRPDKVDIEKVVKLTFIRGEGTEYDPVRQVVAYFNLEGNFIFEIDPCVKYKTPFNFCVNSVLKS